MDKFFHLKENGTTASTEVMAGLTTFFAMSYIIVVNPGWNGAQFFWLPSSLLSSEHL